MLREVLLSFVLLSIFTQRCCVYCGDSVSANRFNTHMHAPMDGGGGGSILQKSHHPAHHPSSSPGSATGSGSILGSGSGGHMESRNSYNLLSEAMSQAVSNEFSSTGGSGSSADGACHADDLECYSMQDRLGMEAIRTLHRQLDDDDNGNIDLSESDDFLREELKYDSGYEKRQKAFHYNDDMHISVKELWEAWLRSEVHNWTLDQTTDWLAQSVQLPQYVDLFKIHKVTGATLPRLAVNNMHYVGNVLGIKDPIHKQKIALKAMDVVLFGPPRETGTRWKDYILVTLLLSAIIGCWYAYQQNKNAKRHLRRMAKDMEGLQKAEQSLQEMQKELERARMEQESVATQKMDLERRLKEVPSLTSSNSDLEVQQLKKEIEMLRTELSRAEVELVDNCWAPPPQLQSWLQYTYELESKNHLKKRVAAEKQLQSAREACEKLRKKRSSLVGAFVSTHGKSIDDVDRSIVEARNSLGEVTNELQERLHRWKQIEQCLGMNIVNNNGLSFLESVLYGRSNGGGGSSAGSLKGSRGRMASSTDDLDDDSVQGFTDGYNRNSTHSANTLIGNNTSALRSDDTSDSEEGSADTTSVQFYLGNNPSTAAAGFAAINNFTTSNAIQTTRSASTTTPSTAIENNDKLNQTAGTCTSNSVHICNDDYVVNGDASRHSPSVSSERSVTVPPRTKKHTPTSSVANINVPSTPPPLPPSDPIGRAPLPPPRKTNQSLLLRSQSSDFMMKPSTQQQPLTVNGNNILNSSCGAAGGAAPVKSKTKKMVKQHSTASQQSTSSTASSVQSAPDLGKTQSPSCSSYIATLEKISPTYHFQQQQHYYVNHPFYTNALRHPSMQPTNITYHQPTDLKTFLLKDTNLSIAHDVHHSDTHLNVMRNSSNTTEFVDNPNNTLKKRRKGLRFSFGKKKIHKTATET